MKKKESKSFLVHVTTLFTGSFFAQLISFAALIILQRLFYTPEDYAPFRLFFEFTAVFSSVGALRLESGLVLEREDYNAITLLRVCIKICVLISIIGGVVFTSYFLNEIEVFNHQYALIVIMPFSIFINGMLQIAQSWFTRKSSYITISKSKVIQSSTAGFFQLSGGFLGWSYIGLILGRFLGLTSGFIQYAISFYKSSTWNKRDKLLEKKLIQKHQKFIWFTTPGIFLGNSINLIILILFTRFYGDIFTGLTAASLQYLGLVIMLFSSSFAQVYYNEISKMQNISNIKKIHTYWLKRLLIISVLGILILWTIPNDWVTFILGYEWKNLMEIIKIISPWMAMMFIASSLSFVFIRLEKQKEIFFFDIFHLVLILISLLSSHFSVNDKWITLYFVTATQFLFYVLSVVIGYFFLNRTIKKTNLG
ncbi:MAG: oligosaccharide flippase family protein [Bacteroidota bacterium]|nr:oligosaccharide flippase family protein [Bacteroidota bacterium]